MSHKKVPVFRNTLPCNGNFEFRVRFRSVLQFPVFFLLCQHFKSTAQRTVKERCENGTKPVRKIITVQRTFKNSTITCLRVYRSDRWYLATTPRAEFYFSEYVEKRTKEILELLLKKDIRASHQGISKFLSRYKQRYNS